MSNLNNNTAQLEALLAKVNALPEAGGGTDTSDATAAADEIFAGETAYGAEGKITGTFTIENELTEQNDLISQIATLVATKATPSGGLNTDDATATAGDILSGKTAYAKGEKITGTIATKTSSNLTASGATVTVPAGYYASQATKSVSTGSAKTPATTVTKNPTISVDSAGKITATVSGTQNVTPTVTAGYVSSGTAGTITVSGSATKQLTTQAAKTVTPSTSSQTAVASGVYTTGAVTVAAIPSSYIQPSGTKSITSNGTHDVKSYESVNVNVASTGEDVTAETNAYTTKLASLTTAITALETELASKASGGNLEPYTVSITREAAYGGTSIYSVFYTKSDGSLGMLNGIASAVEITDAHGLLVAFSLVTSLTHAGGSIEPKQENGYDVAIYNITTNGSIILGY